MEMPVGSKFTRRLLIAVEVVLFMAAAAWIGKTHLAYHASRTLNRESLEEAVKLDPGNSKYHLLLGRLYEYDVADLQPEKSLRHFRRATQLDPYNPQPWLDLGAALALQGNTSEAGMCLSRADLVAPNIPSFQWPIANFCLLQGDTDAAFHHFKVVLAGSSKYDRIIFSTAWKASDDPNRILSDLIPRSIRAEFSYLDYLQSEKRLDEAHPLWRRILNGSDDFAPQRSAGYIHALIAARRPQEAHQVWTDLEKRGLIRSAPAGPDQNLVVNGRFEDELLNFGFAWRVGAPADVYAGVDNTTYRSPSHSLLVQFMGKQNVDFAHVSQYVEVSPGQSYRLQAYVKTENITSVSGPRLEAYDAYDASALHASSEDFRGTTSGWMPVMVDFTTGPKTELVSIRIRRLPTRKIDNLIAGKLWVDDVRLTPLQK
jgi:tetratricopeptide (TPR) repeat protein